MNMVEDNEQQSLGYEEISSSSSSSSNTNKMMQRGSNEGYSSCRNSVQRRSGGGFRPSRKCSMDLVTVEETGDGDEVISRHDAYVNKNNSKVVIPSWAESSFLPTDESLGYEDLEEEDDDDDIYGNDNNNEEYHLSSSLNSRGSRRLSMCRDAPKTRGVSRTLSSYDQTSQHSDSSFCLPDAEALGYEGSSSTSITSGISRPTSGGLARQSSIGRDAPKCRGISRTLETYSQGSGAVSEDALGYEDTTVAGHGVQSNTTRRLSMCMDTPKTAARRHVRAESAAVLPSMEALGYEPVTNGKHQNSLSSLPSAEALGYGVDPKSAGLTRGASCRDAPSCRGVVRTPSVYNQDSRNISHPEARRRASMSTFGDHGPAHSPYEQQQRMGRRKPRCDSAPHVPVRCSRLSEAYERKLSVNPGEQAATETGVAAAAVVVAENHSDVTVVVATNCEEVQQQQQDSTNVDFSKIEDACLSSTNVDRSQQEDKLFIDDSSDCEATEASTCSDFSNKPFEPFVCSILSPIASINNGEDLKTSNSCLTNKFVGGGQNLVSKCPTTNTRHITRGKMFLVYNPNGFSKRTSPLAFYQQQRTLSPRLNQRTR